MQYVGNSDELPLMGKTEAEFEKYRIVQDKLFKSDFDQEIEGLLRD